MLTCFAEVAAPILKLCVLKLCGNKPMSARMAVKAEQKCCCVRGILCSVRNRAPGCGPLTARYAKRALTGQTALYVFLVKALISS